MSIRSRLTSLFFVVSALSMIVSPFAFATTTTRCAETITFAVDGTKGAGTATSIDPASPLNKIADRYRDQTHRVEHVEYPGRMIKGIGGWSESYDQSVAIGISRLEARIAEEESNCGGSSNFVLLGYSQGARIVGDVASNIDSGRFVTESRDLASRVVVILYADPRQPETGIEVALAGVRSTSGITFTGERQPFSVVQVTWVCAPTDGVCDARKPLGVDTFMGYMTTHTNY